MHYAPMNILLMHRNRVREVLTSTLHFVEEEYFLPKQNATTVIGIPSTQTMCCIQVKKLVSIILKRCDLRQVNTGQHLWAVCLREKRAVSITMEDMLHCCM